MSEAADYFSHDAVYRALKARGADGWSSDDEYALMWQLASPALPAVNVSAPGKVLELGSGAGNFSIRLAARGYAVTGIEISPTAVGWARAQAGQAGRRVDFRVGNVVDLAACADASFDAVVDGHCLHCIIGADRAACLASVYRVLKPGGIFIALTMCGEVRDERLRAQFDPATCCVMVNGRPTRHIGTADAIEREVRRAGFGIEQCTVHARKHDREQDDLVIYGRKPLAA